MSSCVVFIELVVCFAVVNVIEDIAEEKEEEEEEEEEGEMIDIEHSILLFNWSFSWSILRRNSLYPRT
jgi:hypothetical protein